MTLFRFIPILVFAAVLSGCEDDPKIIRSDDDSGQIEATPSPASSPPFSNQNQAAFSDDLHAVTVLEVLPTQRYVYLRVVEEAEEYWIATHKMDIETGGVWYYRNGVLKTNFESKEYNRVFEKIFLVSNLVPANHGSGGTPVQIETHGPGEAGTLSAGQPVNREGSMTIADIITNAASLEGQIVQVSGVCTKINPNIMGRNWIHLADGSQDDYDFVITSEAYVAEGAVVTFSAVVSLNQDFGAGYSYELILENGEVVQ